MLSILIPIYQVKIKKLVEELVQQCHKAKINFEIICFDDGSIEKIKTANKSIDLIMGVNYVELSENKGRAKIRNILAKTARYEHLLFLDCDTKIKSKKFIENYVPHLKERGAVCGGRLYSKKQPNDLKKVLHWKYGTQRESRSITKRNKNKLSFFHSNNLLIDRQSIFENPFDESIEGYGYEDLALAYQLSRKGLKITHIDNPTIHNSLEKAQIFLTKSNEATQNLCELYKEEKVPKTRLIKAYEWINTYNLKSMFIDLVKKKESAIMKNLTSHNPHLYYLDLLKLKQFCECSINN